MMFLKDEIKDEDVLYNKHSEIAKTMSEEELQAEINLIDEDTHTLDIIRNAYYQQIKILKRPSRDLSPWPYWKD